MKLDPQEAELHINGQTVGLVKSRGADASWGYGDFVPYPAFSRVAPLFGAWSLLMHVDDDGDELSEIAADELRRAEQAIDHLKVELQWKHDGSITHVDQLNIDGALIEWKKGI